MRRLMLAAVAAFAFATAVGATQTYTMDTNGHCHDAKGHSVAPTKCSPHRNVVCSNGVPCGNTCIPKNKICRQR